MNVCDNLGDHLVGNVYIKVSGEGGGEEPRGPGRREGERSRGGGGGGGEVQILRIN